MVLGAVIGLVGGSYASNANDEASTAYETYDESLRARLNLLEPNNEGRPKHDRKRPTKPEPRETSDESEPEAPAAEGEPKATE